MLARFLRHTLVGLLAVTPALSPWLGSFIAQPAMPEDVSLPLCPADVETDEKHNPNQLLFISCGGFM